MSEEMATSRVSSNKTDILKQLYTDYIQPFEEQWESLHSSQIPSSSAIFRSKIPKVDSSTYCYHSIMK